MGKSRNISLARTRRVQQPSSSDPNDANINESDTDDLTPTSRISATPKSVGRSQNISRASTRRVQQPSPSDLDDGSDSGELFVQPRTRSRPSTAKPVHKKAKRTKSASRTFYTAAEIAAMRRPLPRFARLPARAIELVHQLKAKDVPAPFDSAEEEAAADRLLRPVYPVLVTLVQAIEELPRSNMNNGLSSLTWVVQEWQKKIDNDEVTRPDTKVVNFFYGRCRAVTVPMADDEDEEDEDEDDDTAMFDVAEESNFGTGIRAVNRAIQDALQAVTNGH